MNLKRKYFEAHLGGQLRPLKFGINSAALYCELRGCEAYQYEEDFLIEKIRNNTVDPSCVRDLVWAALKDGERFKVCNLDPSYPVHPFSNTDVGDWLDGMTVEEQKDFSNKYVAVVASNILDYLAKLSDDEIKQASKQKKKF